MSNSKTCANCGAKMAKAFYGMPTQEIGENPEFIIMGCLVDEDMLRFACKSCGLEIYSSGKTIQGEPRNEGNQ